MSISCSFDIDTISISFSLRVWQQLKTITICTIRIYTLHYNLSLVSNKQQHCLHIHISLVLYKGTAYKNSSQISAYLVHAVEHEKVEALYFLSSFRKCMCTRCSPLFSVGIAFTDSSNLDQQSWQAFSDLKDPTLQILDPSRPADTTTAPADGS